MLKGIKLQQDLLSSISWNSEFGILCNFQHINTFVGTNNSGKSRFLRTMFSESRNLKFIFEIEEPQIAAILRSHNQILKNLIDSTAIHGVTYKNREELERLGSDIARRDENILLNIVEVHSHLKMIKESDFEFATHVFKSNIGRRITQIKTENNNIANQIRTLGNDNQSFAKIYIPILRGLRPIDREEEKTFSREDLYLERTKHDYLNKNAPGLIFTGLSIYDDVKRLLLGDESERNEIKEFEKYLERFIFKKKVTLIPKYDDDVLHIKLGDDQQFPIYNLGDGLQTLIIILFPVFVNRDKQQLVFIEEPETHLHPKWQRLLYRTLQEFSKHTFFITTHSSILINAPKNSIFNVSKLENKINISYSDLKIEKIEILKDLGYKPNDLYQTNYLLWVEGPSDKIYFNYLIQKLNPDLIEGEDYSIMFYGGSVFNHFLKNKGDFDLEFISSLNQNYSLIMDSDRKKASENHNPKKKEIEKLFKENNALCWLTSLREIENYIPIAEYETAVKSVHKVQNIEIDHDRYGNRCVYVDLDSKPTYKPRIKLSNDFFSKIQKNKDGTLKGILPSEIKKEIEDSLKATIKTYNSIDKVKVAEKVVENGFDLDNGEIKKTIKEIVKQIIEANL